MKRSRALLSPTILTLSLGFGVSALALPPQSTGMGVTLKDPTPREPDPRVLLESPPPSAANARRLQALRAQRQAAVLAECNQILILAHQLHLKALAPAANPNLPSSASMTSRISELAVKLQKDLQNQ